MTLISCNNGYSVKVKIFDDEHKKIIDYINQLHDAMKFGKGGEAIGTILQSLIDYMATHFDAEEAVMKSHGYPDYERHMNEHNLLVMKVLDVQKNLMAGNVPLSREIMSFLKEWLQTHIQGENKNYGALLLCKGLSLINRLMISALPAPPESGAFGQGEAAAV